MTFSFSRTPITITLHSLLRTRLFSFMIRFSSTPSTISYRIRMSAMVSICGQLASTSSPAFFCGLVDPDPDLTFQHLAERRKRTDLFLTFTLARDIVML
jgi:hypothetical protein